MALLNAEKAAAASQGFQALYEGELVKHPQWATEVAKVIRSTRNSETFPWSTILGGFRKWVGPQIWQSLAVQSVTLTPDDYSFPVEVPKNAVDDDAIGIFSDQFVQMGIYGANLPNKLLSDALVDGYTDLCYDGTPFFGAGHTESGNATGDNSSTDVLDSDAIDDAIDKMCAVEAASGEPVMFSPTHLVVGVGSRAAGQNLINVPTLAGGASNKWYQSMKLIFSPWISGNDWFLLDLSKGIKPLMLLVRQDPDFTAIIDPSAECVKERNVYQYYSHARMTAGYGFWQLAFASTGDGI